MMVRQTFTTADRNPSNDIEAIMVAMPHEEPYAPREGLEELRDTVDQHVALLSPREQWIINGIINENKSLQDIADELGFTKTHIWRLRNQAFEKLRRTMETDMTIRKAVRMAETWEQSASQWLTHVSMPEPGLNPITIEDLEAYRDAASDIIMEDIETVNLPLLFMRIAAGTIARIRRDSMWDTGMMLVTLCGKQHDYGHENINRYGMTGLIIRLSDKIERYKNLMSKNAEAINESTHDTLVDIVGYSIVALMFLDGTFQLDLGGKS